ncbi:MAG: hypothetical protein WBI29_03085 [Candidatus Saccharimonadales bacterium]
MLMKTGKSKGDTIVEVMFAITIFSLVIVSSLAIMNQGTYTAQRSLEISLVRSQMDAQAETLRFLNSSYITAYNNESATYGNDTPAQQWKLIQDKIKNIEQVSQFGNVSTCPEPDDSTSFILDVKNAKFISGKLNKANTFSRIIYDNNDVLTRAEGIWIEAVRSNNANDINQNNSGYIDFHIRACWDSPGQVMPVTLGTIVRLYEPRG